MSKTASVIVVALAALFHWVFMFAKHDPALSPIVPFGVDPYDAVGSFGDIIAILTALLALFRAFRPYGGRTPPVERRVYLARAQTAVVLAVLITLASDAVALARHTGAWTQSARRGELLALLAGLAVAAIAAEAVIVRSAGPVITGAAADGWKRAALSMLAAVLVLAVYPEELIIGTVTHLLTVIVGAVLLFAPMPALLTALVPYASPRAKPEAPAKPGRFGAKRYRWGIAVLIGVFVGAAAFAGEMSEGGGAMPTARFAFVAAVFIGLGTAGLAIAYAFLGRPLGLG